MPSQVRCPSCDRALRVPDNLIGALVKCPSCEATFTAEVDQPRPRARQPEDYEDEPPPRREGVRRREEEAPRPAPLPSRRRRRPDEWEEEDEDYKGSARRVRRSGARGLIAGPATALMVVGGLDIGLALLNLTLHLLGVAVMGAAPAGRRNDADLIANMVGGLCGAFIGLVMGAFILSGATQMKNLRNYGLAMAVSIVAMLPCQNCCLLGLPFGIWALVVLNNPDVKRAFT